MKTKIFELEKKIKQLNGEMNEIIKYKNEKKREIEESVIKKLENSELKKEYKELNRKLRLTPEQEKYYNEKFTPQLTKYTNNINYKSSFAYIDKLRYEIKHYEGKLNKLKNLQGAAAQKFKRILNDKEIQLEKALKNNEKFLALRPNIENLDFAIVYQLYEDKKLGYYADKKNFIKQFLQREKDVRYKLMELKKNINKEEEQAFDEVLHEIHAKYEAKKKEYYAIKCELEYTKKSQFNNADDDLIETAIELVENGHSVESINKLIDLANDGNETAINILKNYDTGHEGRGYSHYSMSQNAIDAYNNGVKPLSVWNSKDAREFSEILGYKITLKKFREYLMNYGEKGYHHTSKMYNKTTFYSIAEAFLRGDLKIKENF